MYFVNRSLIPIAAAVTVAPLTPARTGSSPFSMPTMVLNAVPNINVDIFGINANGPSLTTSKLTSAPISILVI